MSGYIKLYRQARHNFLWPEATGRAYTEWEAWCDLLLSAMHSDYKKFVDGEMHIIRRGSFVSSHRVLANKWKWGRRKVARYLNTLVEEQMIEQLNFTLNTKNGTTIIIRNYEAFQGNSSSQCATSDTTSGATVDATNCTTSDTNNKNDKELKEENNLIAEISEPLKKTPTPKGKPKLPLTEAPESLAIDDDLARWAEERHKILNRQWLQDEAEKCLGFYKANGKQQADWKQVYRNWVNRAFSKGWIPQHAYKAQGLTLLQGGQTTGNDYPLGHPLHNWQAQYQAQQEGRI